MRDSLKAGFDEPATREALYSTYKYRGLLNPDWSWDKKVYKDDNAQNLSRNYAFAHMELAMYYAKQKEFPHAIGEMQRVQRMFPDWVEIQAPLGEIYMAAGDTARAEQFYDELVRRVPGSPEAHYARGKCLLYGNRQLDAVKEFHRAGQLNPDYPNAFYYEFMTLWDLGRHDDGARV